MGGGALRIRHVEPNLVGQPKDKDGKEPVAPTHAAVLLHLHPTTTQEQQHFKKKYQIFVQSPAGRRQSPDNCFALLLCSCIDRIPF